MTLEQLDQKFDEFMDFMKDTVPTKSELDSGLQGVRSEIQEVRSDVQKVQLQVLEVRSEILTVADQVAKIQETVEIELVAPTRRVDRLERRVTAVERKLGLAT